MSVLKRGERDDNTQHCATCPALIFCMTGVKMHWTRCYVCGELGKLVIGAFGIRNIISISACSESDIISIGLFGNSVFREDLSITYAAWERIKAGMAKLYHGFNNSEIPANCAIDFSFPIYEKKIYYTCSKCTDKVDNAFVRKKEALNALVVVT